MLRYSIMATLCSITKWQQRCFNERRKKNNNVQNKQINKALRLESLRALFDKLMTHYFMHHNPFRQVLFLS